MTESDKAWALVTMCLAQGRITPHSHGQYLNQGLANYSAMVEVLAALPVPAASAAEAAPQAGWTFDRFRREAPAVLEAMQTREPARFEALKDLYLVSLRLSKRVPTPAVRSAARPAEQQQMSYAQLRKEAPAVLEKMRMEEPARYEQLKAAHLATLKDK